MTPTYDQLLKDIQASGVYFSDYDLAFAKENPTAGYGILNAKKDYSAATTDEARALANAAAEQWRNLGGYNSGVDGSGYNPILPSAPQSMGNTLLDSKTSQLMSFPSYQSSLPAPTWDDRYGAKYDAALNGMIDYAPFSYDYKTDPLYASYKQAYTREGQRASADALGQAAAASGGIPSSFAATAAAQAGNYYAAQLADKIPDLYQLAYQQYADQYNRMNNNVGALQNARSFDYGTYQDALSQYNADRNFGYGVYSDEFNRLASQIGVLTDQDNTSYQRNQAEMNDARSRIEAFLAAGGDINSLPADLRAASGLTDTELNTLALSAAMGRYGRGGKRTEEEIPNPDLVDYDSAVGKRLVGVSANDPLMAGDILTNNWNNLGYTERFSLLQNMGYDNETAIQLARSDSADMAAYLYGLTAQEPAAPIVVNPVSGGTNVRPKDMGIYASRLAKDQTKDSAWIDSVESALEAGKISNNEAKYLLGLI